MINRKFSVNGAGRELLQSTLRLAFDLFGLRTKATGYRIELDKGISLLWHNAGYIPCTGMLDADAATSMVWYWLESIPEVAFDDFDAGSENLHKQRGWLVYCKDDYEKDHTIITIKPAFLWHRKIVP